MLSAPQRTRLQQSWAGWFRSKALPVLLEMEPEFASLYATGGRPNFSVARLLGISLLQHLECLNDQQALDAYSFDLRWQHALGASDDDAHTTRRTLVEFRRRLVKVDPEGELLRKVFDRIFEVGAKELKLSMTHQRVDSTLVCSNIRGHGRLSLTRETLRVFVRSLDEEQLATVPAAIRAWYRADDEGWEQAADPNEASGKLRQAGAWVAELVQRFAQDSAVRDTEPYALLRRLMVEHADALGVEHKGSDRDEDDKPPPNACGNARKKRRPQRKRKKPKHRGARFWSPHDPDASFGHKGLGYHVEVTETCRNACVELLTDYDVRTAAQPDIGQATPVLQRLQKRGRAPTELYADGGYPTPQSLWTCHQQGTELFSPVHRGRMDRDAWSRADFTRDTQGRIVACPRGHAPTRYGQRHSSDTTHARRSLHVFFDGQRCRSCTDLRRCPVRTPNNKRSTEYRLDMAPQLVARDDRWAEQQTEAWRTKYRIRSGVEATMSELKRAHGMGRLRVRRMVRVRVQVAFKVIACNLKRWRRGTSQPGMGPHAPICRLYTLLRAFIAASTLHGAAANRRLSLAA